MNRKKEELSNKIKKIEEAQRLRAQAQEERERERDPSKDGSGEGWCLISLADATQLINLIINKL